MVLVPCFILPPLMFHRCKPCGGHTWIQPLRSSVSPDDLPLFCVADFRCMMCAWCFLHILHGTVQPGVRDCAAHLGDWNQHQRRHWYRTKPLEVRR